jgi:hypothetical protein
MGQGLGLLLGGAVANRLARRSVHLPLKTGAAFVLLSFPVCLAGLFASSATTSISLMALAGLLWNIPGGATAAAVFSVIPPGIRTTGGMVTVFFASLLGFGLGPSSVGFLSDILAPSMGPEALRHALILPAFFIPLTGLFFLLAAGHLAADLGRRHAGS